MRRIVTLSMFLLAKASVLSASVNPQNLVPNPSFEENTGCPPDFSGIQNYLKLAVPWDSPTNATPDYFHSCSIIMGTPNNDMGHAIPCEGEAYGGFIALYNEQPGFPWIEYLETPLKTPLVANETYEVEAHVQLSEWACHAAIDELGFYFSPVSLVGTPGAANLPVTPQVLTPTGQFLDDMDEWMEIGGTFVASGGEQFLIIGNFKDYLSTTKQSISAACDASFYTYFYVDRVSVSKPCTEPPQDMVGWWPLDETTLSASEDFIADNDGIVYVENAAPVPQPGMVDHALLFLGDGNGFVAAADAPELNFGANEDFSIDAWVRLSALPQGAGTQVLIRKNWAPWFNYGYALFLEDDLLHLGLISSTGKASLLSTTTVPNDTSWHLFAVTVDRDDPQGARFYVDGTQLGNALDPTLAIGDLTTDAPFAIGGDPSPWVEAPTLDGTIDEVELFARALTSAEVLAIYESGPQGKCKTDCNGNGILDREDIAAGISFDLDGNGIPDECEEGFQVLPKRLKRLTPAPPR